MKLNPFAVMAEQFDGTGLVFNPESNGAVSLNKTGVYLWNRLKDGATESGMAAGLIEQYDGVTGEKAAADVKVFWKNCGNGRCCRRSEGAMKRPDKAFYTGNSMRGVFVPGETLVLSETAFETLRTGDVVAMFDRTPHVVHRIVGKSADSAVTMGDNNDRPDAMKLTPGVPFRLVTGVVSADGAIRPVAGGEAGMRQFRLQQRKRKLRHAAGLLARPLKPLKFMRIPARRETRFLDGTVQWSFAGIPVAARAPSGRFMYLHWSKRLFFRVSSSSPDGTRSPERTEG